MTRFIHVGCPCGQTVRAREEQSGTQVRCWSCRGEVSVPGSWRDGRLSRGFKDDLRAVTRFGPAGAVLAGAVTLAALAAVPRAGGWLALGLLAAAAWRYQDLVRRNGAGASAWAVRLALAVLGVAALLAPAFVRNGGHLLPGPRGFPAARPLAALALAGWVVAPLLLTAANARGRRALAALARRPGAALAALLVVPLGLAVWEALLVLVGWWFDQLPLLVADLFPPPRSDFRLEGEAIVYTYDGVRFERTWANMFAKAVPTYLNGLRRGFTLVGTLPGSLASGLTVRKDPGLFYATPWAYLAVRSGLSVLTVAWASGLFAVQALWLGRVASGGAADPVGSTPPVSLPALQAPAAAAVEPTRARVGQRPTVLIIDDERAFALALTRILGDRGFDTLLAHDAEEGLRLARSTRPDLILLDLLLPDRPGIEVCRDLRGGETTCRIPVVVATYKNGADDEVAALTRGADAFVTKPYAVDFLVAKLREQIRRRGD